MVSAGSYLISAAALIALVASLGFSAFWLRARLLASWHGAPARLLEAIVALALLIWISELLGTFNLFYGGLVVAVSVLLAAGLYLLGGAAALRRSARRTGGSDRSDPRSPGARQDEAALPAPAVGRLGYLVSLAVVSVVVARWGLTTKQALDGGIFNFDSLWYHMPFAVDMVQSHSLTAMHYTDTVFTNWFYPQNSELLHAVGIALTHRDTLSLFINFGWLALAFLAAWCIGRPYGRGHLTLLAAAIILDSHTLIVREPGAAKNDLAAAALLLGAIAILVNLWAQGQAGGSETQRAGAGGSIPLGWALAAAGLAVGLAAGTKVTVLAMAAALSLAVVVLAPRGRRRAAAWWWFVPALLGGGFWYLRNLAFAGSPLPEIAHLGPITLPHPERLQSARPGFAISHYATDFGVWRHYFVPGLHQAFGALWPLILAGAVLAAALALFRGRDRVIRWIGAVALIGMIAYLFTPLGAAGAQGAPVAFAINVRYVEAALLAGIVLLPLAAVFDRRRRQSVLIGVLVIVLVISDRADAVLRDPSRIFAWALVALFVLVPAALLWGHRRGVRPLAIGAGAAALGAVVIAVGYPLQRDYLRERFAKGLPGMHLNSAYRWARRIDGARIGLVGTTAGFLQYGFYGTELSNRVIYLGAKGAHGAFNAIPTCRAFRAAVNAADLDFLVTAPFLNFIHTQRPIPSPEAGWLRDQSALLPILRSGPVTVWRVAGSLDPARCGPANAPLRRIPNAPS